MVEQVVLRALHKKPEERFASVSDSATTLCRARQETIRPPLSVASLHTGSTINKSAARTHQAKCTSGSATVSADDQTPDATLAQAPRRPFPPDTSS